MHKNIYGKLKALLVLATPILLFQNCVIEFRPTPYPTPTPFPSPAPDHDVIEIDYSLSGGFPGPLGPLHTKLNLRLQANGSIESSFADQSCANKGVDVVSRTEYDLIVKNSTELLSLPADQFQGGEGAICADCPTTDLKFTYSNGVQLKRGPLPKAQETIDVILRRHRAVCLPTPVSDVSSIRYYRGGWFGLPPNWSHDYVISLRGPVASISGKDFDPRCFKVGSLDESEVKKLLALVASLQTGVSDGYMIVDAGQEYIEVVSTAGTTRKIFLNREEVPVGGLYALNPVDLSNYLRQIPLSTGCEGAKPIE